MVWVILVAAALVVLGTSLIKFAGLSEKVKNLIAIGLSVVAGVAILVVGGHLSDLSTVTDASGLLGVIASIYGTSQVLYHYILNGTGLDAKLEAFAAPTPAVVADPVVPADTVIEPGA